jgi:hypothetical protein
MEQRDGREARCFYLIPPRPSWRRQSSGRSGVTRSVDTSSFHPDSRCVRPARRVASSTRPVGENDWSSTTGRTAANLTSWHTRELEVDRRGANAREFDDHPGVALGGCARSREPWTHRPHNRRRDDSAESRGDHHHPAGAGRTDARSWLGMWNSLPVETLASSLPEEDTEIVLGIVPNPIARVAPVPLADNVAMSPEHDRRKRPRRPGGPTRARPTVSGIVIRII